MSNVPMTRPNETLAVHPPTSMAPNTFVELRDGRILGAAHFGDSGSSIFTISDDKGLTWSDPRLAPIKKGGPIYVRGLVGETPAAVA